LIPVPFPKTNPARTTSPKTPPAVGLQPRADEDPAAGRLVIYERKK